MKAATTFSELHDQLTLRLVPFFVVFFIIMVITYGILFLIDFIPEPVDETAEATAKIETTSSVNSVFNAINGGLRPKDSAEEVDGSMRVVIPEEAETAPSQLNIDPVDPLPRSVTISALGRTVPVLNPTSRSVAVLDEALLSGVVRHPDSADFSEPGNILILGHSSYLPNVFNKNFQAFNGLQELTWGDEIRVTSGDTEYVYQVDRVYKASATNVEVPVTRGQAKLTLVTCNSFGAKEDRFIVEASLIETHTL